MGHSVWAVLGCGVLAFGGVACGGSSGPRTTSFGGGQSPSADAPAAEATIQSAPSDGAEILAGEGQAPRQPSGDGDDVAAREDRPGLGTEWGESRFSRISSTHFQRADSRSPFVTAGLFYNDRPGFEASTDSTSIRRHRGSSFNIGGGALSFGIKDSHGSFFPGFTSGDDRRHVIGNDGDRYTIVVRNHSDMRFEIVLSVDGLDVLDGKSANFKKRGYLVAPFGELEVEGFRQSTDSVAAFRFGSIDNSYAERKHGESRNVGVIGLAAFHERGDNPLGWNGLEVDRRRNANPFPGQFATPPN